MDSVLISVVTTVKNGAPYLREMLESVRMQSFKNFEHVVIDDGSTDDTLQILRSFVNDYPSYRLKVESSILGRAKALNYAVELSSANLIAIIDADDLWHPRKLELQYNAFQNIDIDVLSTDTLLFNNVNEFSFTNNSTYKIDFFVLKDLLITNMMSHSSVMIKKDICSYDENRKSQFDYELWLRLSMERLKIGKIDLPLSFHRIHEMQSFESKMKKLYRWRAYKLKVKMALESKNYGALIFGTAKLGFDMLLPRQLRFRIRELVYKK